MEEWEVIVDRYQDVQRKSFLEACECAYRVLKDDLTSSEIAWFVDTLLLEPVNLLTTIANKWKDPVWFDPIGKAFKLLSNVIEKFKEECSQHFDNIIRICEIPFESRQRALALQCLTSLVPYCEEVANNYNKHLVSLSNEKTCKAPLAELIGAICCHYPDIVKSNVAKIWRVYLNLLDSKHSDTVMRSLLLGVSGVLKSFGNELDTKEFPVFYKHLVDSGSISKCRDVYLKILAKHADLFRELLANDPRIRMSLWQSYPDSDTHGVNRQAILSVYNAIEQVFKENRSKFNAIVNTETFKFKHSSNCELKYTVLRVLHAVNTRAARVYCDMHAIHALRHDRLTYEHCEMIQWCLEYNLEKDMKLLKSVSVFYKNIPDKYQREIAVNCILRAPSSDRKIAIIFLANETCKCYKENGNIDKYLPLWMLFFENSDEPKSKVFLDFMEYLHESLLQYELNENLEELPDRLTYLIIISSYIIPLGGDVRGEGVSDVSRGVQRLLAGMEGLGGAVLRVARLLRYGSDDLYADMVKDVSLEDCTDDLMLNESCLALVLTASRVTVTRVLQALQIIFSRSVHFEAKILSRCLKALDNLISTRNEELNLNILNNIIRLLQKMQHNEYKGKDGRYLRKELFMFIGKHGQNTHMNENVQETIHLEKYMNLSVPVVNEGIIIKLNLQEIHNLALKYGDSKMLQVLLDLLYANLLERVPNEKVLTVLSKSACSLLQTAQVHTQILSLCGNIALPIILWFHFTETVSNGDRSAASTALKHIGHYEKLASAVLNDTTLYSVNKQAFLDIAEMLVNIMKEDNVLAQKYLPEIILRTAETNLTKANIIFKNATDLFIDKIELFRNVIIGIVMKLLNVIQDGGRFNKMADVLILKNKIKLTLDFIKQIYGEEINWCEVFEVIEKQNGDVSRLFVILSIAKEMFDFDESFSNKLLKENFVGFNIEENCNCLYLDGILNFCIQYADILVKLHLEDTVRIISTILLKLKPKEIIDHRQHLLTCLKRYENLLKCLPKEFIMNFKLWCKEFEIDKIAIDIKNDFFEDINLIKSLKILLNIFDKNVENDLIKEIKIWLPLIVEKHQNGIKKRFIPYFTDLLHIIFKFLPTPDIERVVILEGFSVDFMPVVFHHLVMNFDLVKILHQRDVMKVLVKYSKIENYDVLDLVDQLWPEFEKVSTFEQQYSLLLEVSFLPNKLLPESKPMQWLINTMKSETSTCEMKTKLIGLLPPGEAYKSTWSWYVGLLPARLSEAQGESGLLLGALLEALIAADSSLLKTISQLIAGETASGWWDDAIDASMVSLSKRNDMSVYGTLYAYCWEGLSLEVCFRLMVPLLRNSTAAVCEEFFSLKLKDLLLVLKKTLSVYNSSFTCQIVVYNYIRALVLLRVCIEMVPRSHIESPKSLLYSQMTDEVGTEVFYLTKTLSMLCVDLVQNRRVKIPNLGFDSITKNCLLFYCENYNSLVSAIWCRQPSDPKFYSLVFDVKTWCRIVDPYLEYQLPLVESWQKRTMHQYAGVKLEESSGLLTSASSSTARTYLRTLSENPGEFDEGLIQDDQECQELCIPENVINQHPCAGILTMSLSRATSLPHTTWLTTTLTTLTTNTYKNAKWLLAQAICNCREDLKVHASTLSPALLTMVVQTSGDHLNSLHIDVIDLVIYWGQKDFKPDTINKVNIILKKLVETVIQNRRNKKIVTILMQKMNLILETFEPLEIEWSCLSECVHVKNEELAKIYISILKTLTKKIYIRGLILELVKKLESKDTQTIKQKDIAFLFARCLKIPANDRIENLNTFRKVLNKYKNNIKDYVDIVLFAVRENADISDVELFRSIIKLLPKMVEESKTKCLEILSLTIKEKYSDDVKSLFLSKEVCKLVQEGDSATLVLVGRGLTRMGRGLTIVGRGLVLQSAKHCRSDVKKVRDAAFGVLRSAVECLFTDDLETPPKRSARFSSPLLQDEELKVALATLGMKLVSDDGLRDAVSSCLPTEVTTRFCESFIISVYLPVVYGDCKSTNCLTALLYMFFKDIRDTEALKRNLITEHIIKEFPTTSKDITQNIDIQNEDPTVETKTVDDVLDTLLQFCKTGDAASALILQLLKYLQSVSSILPAALTPLLLQMVSHVGDTTPFVIQVCRLFIDECCHTEGFKPAVEELLKSVKGTEGEILVRVLLEDVEIRLSGLDYFVLGATQDGKNSEMMDLSREYSLEDVVNSFNSLSNWDNLTLQEQETTANDLPPLWTCMDNFRKQIDDWKVTSSNTWFDKILLIYQKSKNTYKYVQWQNDVCRWPKRQFAISATIDSFELKRMQDEEHAQELECHIQSEDCLVEWAARIMTRSACIQKMYEDMEESCPISPSHSHALRWCARANEMALPLQVLSCMRTIDECELSTLPWRCEELLARRQLALNRNDTEELIQIRDMAVCYSNDLLVENKTTEAMVIELKPGTSKQENIDCNIKLQVNNSRLLLNNTPVKSILGLNYIIINLQKDLNDLSAEKLKFLLNDSRDRLKTSESSVVGENKKVLHNMVIMAVTHYDENWPMTNAIEQNKLLIDITEAIDVGLDFDLDLKYSMLLDVLLHRMSSVEKLDSSASDALLLKMDNLKHYLDEFAIDEIKRNQSKLSSVNELVNELSKDMQRLKQCLQLVADPRHLMKHYLKQLLEALENNDVGAWSTSFDRMKNKIFENSYAGVDYQVLNKFKETLYKISEYDANNKDSLKESLLGIIKELTSQSESFKLSQLCPALTQAEFVRGSEIQDCLSLILNLPQGVRVQRFEEQVSVFTDSKRRPVVVAVRLSDGRRRRLLLKSGEELKMDAASLRMLRTLGITSQEYQVTLLSEDSGLIEFLEDHVRVRALIANKYDIKGIESTLGEKLIQDTREHSISQYKKMCSKIPAHAFRSVMELNSSGFQDFIMKKQNYEESLAAMTYATSLLGLKDRHLENILYKVHGDEGGRGGGGRGGCGGCVLAVDWNSALRHDQHEPPPARLTRCLLAPCNLQVLENRLQKLTSETRSIHRLLLSTLQLSYKWMGNEIQEKLENVYYLMQGKKLSHQVSVRNQKSFGDYELLLNHIFKDFASEKVYTVKQQVTNLLRHCTDPQILAITRSAWEPWI
ncbi:PREDICTED: uncharacterized protein LOC106107610 isoform X2 [Papilio polytes]|uniref:uncharacterized protein LOC106107610 isoform X2 n=1 Tax=Papilio polytes TaxID=76194 RepID=UPI0006766962|nr:PREDICTED: uncharacterized protein LOC106107610 isoform X2 [Papilio polytes]